jgi:hypothetical protein
MRWLAAGFVFAISAETAISWRIRSVAGHGWFGSEHGEIRIPKSRDPNPNAVSRILFWVWDLGFGFWDLRSATG